MNGTVARAEREVGLCSSVGLLDVYMRALSKYLLGDGFSPRLLPLVWRLRQDERGRDLAMNTTYLHAFVY